MMTSILYKNCDYSCMYVNRELILCADSMITLIHEKTFGITTFNIGKCVTKITVVDIPQCKLSELLKFFFISTALLNLPKFSACFVNFLTIPNYYYRSTNKITNWVTFISLLKQCCSIN